MENGENSWRKQQGFEASRTPTLWEDEVRLAGAESLLPLV